MLIYGLDIGGSSVKHAIIEVGGASPRMVTAYEPLALLSTDFADLQEVVVDAVGRALADGAVERVGISTTGSVDGDGMVINAGHFHDYSNVSWRSILTERYPRIQRVTTVNDGRASAWAEYQAASPRPTVFAHFVVGTGIGGATIMRGQLVMGESGYAGYLGHIKVALDAKDTCSCGLHGCVETVASAPAIVRFHNARAPQSKTFQEIVRAAASGDTLADEAFRVAGSWLGIAISNVINILNPGLVTIGGGVVEATRDLAANSDPFLSSAKETALAQAHRRVAAATTIRAASYLNDGGIIGAALLAANKTNS